MPEQPTPQQTRRITSLENKIAYWRRYLDDSRSSIHSQFENRQPQRMNEKQLAHWTKYRDDALARVDTLEASRVTPLETEYRQLMGLDG
jgi:hypothetical protein